MVQSIPLFSLSTEWRAGGPHWHCKWSRRPTLTVAVHCAYFVSPALALQVEPKAHTQSGEVSTVCGMGDGLCWVDPWGCASVREEEMGGVVRPVWCFRPWREARGLEVVAEEVGPRARCRGTRGRAGGVRAGPAAA